MPWSPSSFLKNSRDEALSTFRVTALPFGAVQTLPGAPLISVSSLAVSRELIVTGLLRSPPLAALVPLTCSVSMPRSWKVWFRSSTALWSHSIFINAHEAGLEDQVSESSTYWRMVLLVAPPHR